MSNQLHTHPLNILSMNPMEIVERYQAINYIKSFPTEEIHKINEHFLDTFVDEENKEYFSFDFGYMLFQVPTPVLLHVASVIFETIDPNNKKKFGDMTEDAKKKVIATPTSDQIIEIMKQEEIAKGGTGTISENFAKEIMKK